MSDRLPVTTAEPKPASGPNAAQGERKRLSAPVDFLVRLWKEKPLGLVGGLITLLLLATGIFADFMAPNGMNEVHLTETLLPPGARYLLGTDNLGRDILSRVIYGARVSLIVGFSGAALASSITALIGGLSGYIGGKFDLVVQRFVDAVMSIPGIILLLVLISLIGPSMWSIILMLGVLGGIGHSRVIRGAVIGIKENAYVTAAQAIGCPTSGILTRHILPNVVPALIIQFSVNMPGIILAEASLSYLGYGIPPPTPSWGGMIGISGRPFFFLNPFMVIWPGLALSIVVYGVNMFGDAVRDILDPRLRGGIGRFGARL